MKLTDKVQAEALAVAGAAYSLTGQAPRVNAPITYGDGGGNRFVRDTHYNDPKMAWVRQQYEAMCICAGIVPIPPFYIMRPGLDFSRSLSNYDANLVFVGGHAYPYISEALWQKMSPEEIVATLAHETRHYQQAQSVRFNEEAWKALDSPANEKAADAFAAQHTNPNWMISALRTLGLLDAEEERNPNAPRHRMPKEKREEIKKEFHHPSLDERIRALENFRPNPDKHCERGR